MPQLDEGPATGSIRPRSNICGAQASLSELRELAALKDEESFAKEAMFSSNRMNTRLAQKCESPNVQDAPSAPYLRRKSSQGKADPKSPQA